MSMSNGVTGGNFVTETDMQASDARVDTIVTVTVASVRTTYLVEVADGGSGVSLDNGLYANPIDKFKDIIGDTNLVIGGKYFSSVTKSHTVPAGVSVGDEIIITWKDGTTMTLTSASNMSVTSATKTTDTTWVFTNFIAILTLVWDGTEWGIK